VTRSDDAYKATEKRLYNLPVLKIKVENDKEKLIELQTNGSPMRSKSVVRFDRSGSRLKPDEILDALIQDVRAKIAANEHEIETVEKALSVIDKDPYYKIIPCLYFHGMNFEDTGEEVACDRSTVFRHWTRLVQRIAVFLYGVDA
jgi:DNA-directed RNA polymerase specialized sigma subunit